MLQLEEVHAFYGAGHILHGVDLDIPAAKVSAVLGRNGVGKTTMVRAIMGLVPRRTGGILLGERNIVGAVVACMVECEFALGPFPSEAHAETCRIYAGRGRAAGEPSR